MRQGNGTGSHTMVQRHGMARDLTVCGLFTALTAVGAFIKIVIPVGADTMNFTLQWFFVLLAGLLLGSRRAFLSVATYLLIGLVGIPVFARSDGRNREPAGIPDLFCDCQNPRAYRIKSFRSDLLCFTGGIL